MTLYLRFRHLVVVILVLTMAGNRGGRARVSAEEHAASLIPDAYVMTRNFVARYNLSDDQALELEAIVSNVSSTCEVPVRVQLDYLYTMLTFAEVASEFKSEPEASDVGLLFPDNSDVVTSTALFRSKKSYTGRGDGWIADATTGPCRSGDCRGSGAGSGSGSPLVGEGQSAASLDDMQELPTDLDRTARTPDMMQLVSLELPPPQLLMYYRYDLFRKYELVLPATWSDLADWAAAVNGTVDADGDGLGDWALCLDTLPACKSGFLLMAMMASAVQPATEYGTFFEPKTMKPLVSSKAFTLALGLFSRLARYSPPDATATAAAANSTSSFDQLIACRPYEPAFFQGRCLLTISFDQLRATTTTIAGTSSAAGYGNDTVTAITATTTARGALPPDALGVAVLPGSEVLLNRSSGEMAACGSDNCPNAVSAMCATQGDFRVLRACLVNRAPVVASLEYDMAVAPYAHAASRARLIAIESRMLAARRRWGAALQATLEPPANRSSSTTTTSTTTSTSSPPAAGTHSAAPERRLQQLSNSAAAVAAAAEGEVAGEDEEDDGAGGTGAGGVEDIAMRMATVADWTTVEPLTRLGYSAAEVARFLAAYWGSLLGTSDPWVTSSPSTSTSQQQLPSPGGPPRNVVAELDIRGASYFTNIFSRAVEWVLREGASPDTAALLAAAETEALLQLAATNRTRLGFKYCQDIGWSGDHELVGGGSGTRDGGGGRGGSGGGGGLSGPQLVAVIIAPVCATCLAVLAVAMAAVAVVRRRRRWAAASTVGPPGPGLGTTLILTDIQNSTVLWESLPADVMDAAIRCHHEVIRGLLPAHRGYESATEGDAFVLAFHTAEDAAGYSVAAQELLLTASWPSEMLTHPDCEVVWMAPNRADPVACLSYINRELLAVTGKTATAAAAAAAGTTSGGGLQSTACLLMEGKRTAVADGDAGGSSWPHSAPLGLLNWWRHIAAYCWCGNTGIEPAAAAAAAAADRVVISGSVGGKVAAGPEGSRKGTGFSGSGAARDGPGGGGGDSEAAAAAAAGGIDGGAASGGGGGGTKTVDGLLGRLAAASASRSSKSKKRLMVLTGEDAVAGSGGGGGGGDAAAASAPPVGALAGRHLLHHHLAPPLLKSPSDIRSYMTDLEADVDLSTYPTHALGNPDGALSDGGGGGGGGTSPLPPPSVAATAAGAAAAAAAAAAASQPLVLSPLASGMLAGAPCGAARVAVATAGGGGGGGHQSPRAASRLQQSSGLNESSGTAGCSGGEGTETPAISPLLALSGTAAVSTLTEALRRGWRRAPPPGCGESGGACGGSGSTSTASGGVIHGACEGTCTQPLLAFRGMRVRMGIHTGADLAEVSLNKATGRNQYSGTFMTLAKHVCDAAHGGQVLLSPAAFKRLPPGFMAKCRAMLLHMGEHVLGEGEEPGPLYQLLPYSLSCRLPAFAPLRTHEYLALGLPDAPVGRVTVAFMYVVGAQTLLAWNPVVAGDALDIFHRTVSEQMHGTDGYVVELVDGLCLAAFRSSADALLWSLRCGRLLLAAPWSDELLEHELCEEVALLVHAEPAISALGAGAGGAGQTGYPQARAPSLTHHHLYHHLHQSFQQQQQQGAAPQPRTYTLPRATAIRHKVLMRGLRLKVGMDIGFVADSINTTTGRMAYRGRPMNRAARIAARALAGQVHCSAAVWGAAADRLAALARAGVAGHGPGGGESGGGLPPGLRYDDDDEVAATSLGLQSLKGVMDKIEVMSVSYKGMALTPEEAAVVAKRAPRQSAGSGGAVSSSVATATTTATTATSGSTSTVFSGITLNTNTSQFGSNGGGGGGGRFFQCRSVSGIPTCSTTLDRLSPNGPSRISHSRLSHRFLASAAAFIGGGSGGGGGRDGRRSSACGATAGVADAVQLDDVFTAPDGVRTPPRALRSDNVIADCGDARGNLSPPSSTLPPSPFRRFGVSQLSYANPAAAAGAPATNPCSGDGDGDGGEDGSARTTGAGDNKGHGGRLASPSAAAAAAAAVHFAASRNLPFRSRSDEHVVVHLNPLADTAGAAGGVAGLGAKLGPTAPRSASPPSRMFMTDVPHTDAARKVSHPLRNWASEVPAAAPAAVTVTDRTSGGDDVAAFGVFGSHGEGAPTPPVPPAPDSPTLAAVATAAAAALTSTTRGFGGDEGERLPSIATIAAAAVTIGAAIDDVQSASAAGLVDRLDESSFGSLLPLPPPPTASPPPPPPPPPPQSLQVPGADNNNGPEDT